MEHKFTTVHRLEELRNLNYDVDSFVVLSKSLLPIRCTGLYRFIYSSEPLDECQNKKLTKDLNNISKTRTYSNFYEFKLFENDANQSTLFFQYLKMNIST